VDFGLLRPTDVGHLYVVTRDLSEISLNVRVEGNKGTRIASDGKGTVSSVRMVVRRGRGGGGPLPISRQTRQFLRHFFRAF
jgi:hypothetical protein